MIIWKHKLAVDPLAIKDGNIHNWICACLKEFFIKAKQRDNTFVWYKYHPEEGEPDTICKASNCPETMAILQGEGPSNRHSNCYLYGLCTWNLRGAIMNIRTEMRVGHTKKDTPKLLRKWIMSIVSQPYLRKTSRPQTQRR